MAARRPPLEEALSALKAVRAQPDSPESLNQLRAALRRPENALAAKAATIARDFELTTLAPDLAGAFDRFMTNPAKTDKGCAAKTAIVHALCAMGADEPDLYRRGIRHVQMEAVWGPAEDTAAELRGACAVGLANLRRADALPDIVDLLADSEPAARAAAAHALARAGREEGALPLRLKILIGDEEPEVVRACLAALIAVGGRMALKFAAKLLETGLHAEAAAYALGESRRSEAFEILRQHWEETATASMRTTLVKAIALIDSEGSNALLLGLIEEESEKAAADAIAGLAVWRRIERVRKSVEETIARRGSRALAEIFRKEFDAPES